MTYGVKLAREIDNCRIRNKKINIDYQRRWDNIWVVVGKIDYHNIGILDGAVKDYAFNLGKWFEWQCNLDIEQNICKKFNRDVVYYVDNETGILKHVNPQRVILIAKNGNCSTIAELSPNLRGHHNVEKLFLGGRWDNFLETGEM